MDDFGHRLGVVTIVFGLTIYGHHRDVCQAGQAGI